MAGGWIPTLSVSPARAALWLGLLLLAACGGNGRWDGRRGYDGSGDYGYDINASRASARSYRARAARSYPAPGPASDPWGPYIREAGSRFAVPERWIREVMRQESGGQLVRADGSLTTSWVGAMGLMQVMPATYDGLSSRYGLRDDPYEPHDNIMAGTAYIREMYDRFGAPGFLAAYNAGPDRLNAYLGGSGELPDETVNYVARVAPRLGNDVAMTGPLAVYADATGGGTSGRGTLGQPYAIAAVETASYDGTEADRPPPGSADRAYDDPGTIVARPTPERSPAPSSAPVVRVLALTSAAGNSAAGNWAIQVGAYPEPKVAQAAIVAARAVDGAGLAGAEASITPVSRDSRLLYRARLAGLSADGAAASCEALARQGIGCFRVPPGS